MNRMTNGTQWRETPAGIIAVRGNRELHLLGTSVNAQTKARAMLAGQSFDQLFKSGRKAPGQPKRRLPQGRRQPRVAHPTREQDSMTDAPKNSDGLTINCPDCGSAGPHGAFNDRMVWCCKGQGCGATWDIHQPSEGDRRRAPCPGGCDCHWDGPPQANGMAACCDPNDCGPCCEKCPTCPSVQRWAAESASSAQPESRTA